MLRWWHRCGATPTVMRMRNSCMRVRHCIINDGCAGGRISPRANIPLMWLRELVACPAGTAVAPLPRCLGVIGHAPGRARPPARAMS